MIRRARARCASCKKSITLALYVAAPDEPDPMHFWIACLACEQSEDEDRLTLDDIRREGRNYHRSGPYVIDQPAYEKPEESQDG